MLEKLIFDIIFQFPVENTLMYSFFPSSSEGLPLVNLKLR